MDRPKINYFIDFFALISFLITSLTGIFIFLFLPGGIRQGRFQELLGIAKEAWNFIHIWSGILMLILVVIHLVLHWEWLVCMTKNIFGNSKNK